MRDHYLAFTKEKPLTFSFSQYSSIKMCHLKAYFDYIIRYRKHLPKGHFQVHGLKFHKIMEWAFKYMKIKDGEVDMLSEFIEGVDNDKVATEMLESLESELSPHVKQMMTEWVMDVIENGIQDEVMREMLFWIEDWMHTYYLDNGTLPKVILEQEIWAPVEQVEGVWIRRMGFIDMIWELADGSIFLWDFKTGHDKKFKVSNSLHQLYFYKGIKELNGATVSGVGLIFPEAKSFHRRLVGRVPKGTKNTSRIRASTLDNLEKNIKKAINKVITTPVCAEYNPYYCDEWCDYAQEDTMVCDYDEEQDLDRFTKVGSYDELIDLVLNL